MKRLQITDHIITFYDDGIEPHVPDDKELVARLLDSDEVTVEIKALARLVLSLAEERDKEHGSID